MSRILSHRPSPSMVIALIALFVAMGGGAYAATSIPAHSVGTKQLKNKSVGTQKLKDKSVGTQKLKNKSVGTKKLKNEAVTSAKVKDHSLLANDFKEGQLPAGPQGPEGPAGTALAYAEVEAGGTLVTGRYKGIAQANVSSPSVGVYCFGGLSFTPTNVVAARQGGAASPGVVNYRMSASAGCPASTQVTLTAMFWNGTTFVPSANKVMVLFN